ncbi:helix-turn-helix transcriptional regulator [Enterocloster citroniae]|uniref:helix-turn-helix transcriptional regulator n=1 Tax=Enterocloster citroniae TaxID=358743 RepID=UPI00349E8942
MSIGDNIKKWRELRNLKQSELAEVLGVSDKTVSSWEINRTEPKMGMVEKICKALNCKKTDIIGADSEMTSVQPDIVISFPDGSQALVEMKRATHLQEKCLARLLKYYSLLNELGQKKALDNLEDLAKIYSETKTVQYDFTPPTHCMVAEDSNFHLAAAHNDHLDEEGELDKVKLDLTKLKKSDGK